MTHEELVLLVKVVASDGGVPVEDDVAEAIAKSIEEIGDEG